MKTSNLIFCFIILFSNLEISMAQNIFVYPSVKEIDIDIRAKVTLQSSKYIYEYELTSLLSSQQDVWTFDVFFEGVIENLEAPINWEGEVGRGVPRISWGANDTLSFILPGATLEGFRYKSTELPSIQQFLSSGWVPIPVLQTEPDFIIGDSIFENSKIGKTIAPRPAPVPFDASTFLDTLKSYTSQSLALLWIANQTTADKYEGYFSTAQTELQQADTTAARSELQTVLQEVEQDSGSVLTSEAYALLRFNTEFLLDQLPVTQSQFSIFSVFATHSIWLKKNSAILSGSVAVNDSGAPPFLASNVELSVGQKATTPSGDELKAHRIKVTKKAVVNSDVFYNQLTNNGTINGSLNTLLSLPLFTVLPPFQSAPAGAQDITVAKNDSISLAPGDYGDIKVKKKGVILFTGGIYNVRSLDFGNNTKMLFGGPSEVRIEEKFKTGKKTYIGPQNTTTMSAKDIVFYVVGMNGKTGKMGASPKSAKVGLNNTVFANFYVPNGMLWLRKNSVAEGAFIGKDVSVGKGVKVTLNSAF